MYFFGTGSLTDEGYSIYSIFNINPGLGNGPLWRLARDELN